eukprot:TRINITY_DN29943_c0_g1_i1.p1 TRINITY_DN29943_c0_g1~~TRINITY_DN29943_c0_g1_i1.p1  ORF type:complete len:153 (+),score=20.04 TRINITY_DN29943_c0_g1_i1:660-1118(+)
MNYLNVALKPIGTVVACAYPFYASFKALDSKSTDASLHWLAYWAVVAVFTVVEMLLSFLLKWFPLYYTLKICFLLWLQLPQTKGSSLVYWKGLHPQVKKHEEQIDQMFLEGRRKAFRLNKEWPASMASRSSLASDKVLQDLEEGDAGEKKGE